MCTPCDLYNEFVLLIKAPSFYEKNSFNRKWHVRGGIGGISKIFFLGRPFFTIIFRPEMLELYKK